MFEWIDSLHIVPAVGFLLVVIYLRAGGTYALGRLAYRAADRGRLSAILSSPRVIRAMETINRYGAPIVAVSFLTVGFQTACNLAAGVTRMPLSKYLPALAVGGFAWAVIYATVGLAAFNLWWRIALANPWLAGIIAVIFVGLLTWHIVRQRLRRNREARAAAAKRQTRDER